MEYEEPLDLVDKHDESIYESLIEKMSSCSLNSDFRIKKGDPSNLKIPCMIRRKFIANAYINLDSPMNVMFLACYNAIRIQRYEFRGHNFVGIGRDMHVFVGNISHVIAFTILEKIEANIDPREDGCERASDLESGFYMDMDMLGPSYKKEIEKVDLNASFKVDGSRTSEGGWNKISSVTVSGTQKVSSSSGNECNIQENKKSVSGTENNRYENKHNINDYNMFAMEKEHPKQPESVNDTNLDDALNKERDLLASLIENFKCEIDDSNNRNKILESSNKAFKEANKQLGDVNKLMSKDLDKFQIELDRNSSKIMSKTSQRESIGSNDMVHNYYLEEAKQKAKIQKENALNSKPSMQKTTRLPNLETRRGVE
ncbi:hypothetical protein Tco_0502349 [Tanacetum coccineum]|uniref:Uncharacterized protein n=1 Tax=Tanacetum coccineum TaxID=301880 RepID=A0ABQ5DSV6_9ASTR